MPPTLGSSAPVSFRAKLASPALLLVGCVTLSKLLQVLRLNFLLHRKAQMTLLYEVVVRIQQDDVNKVVDAHYSSAVDAVIIIKFTITDSNTSVFL